ncbi:sortase domain-containing protein, partial [Clostridium butyricum]|uniref:sortase domain-containing protein n=1 Tax=Clostridium butyricum TaxID=1492 RepID=UPI0034665854
FSGLKNYLHKTWFENHSIIKIQYKGQSLSYKVFSVNILPEEDTASYVYQFNNREYEDFLKELLLNSLIDSGVEIHDAPIITLSTCYGTGKRLIIAAQEVN